MHLTRRYFCILSSVAAGSALFGLTGCAPTDGSDATDAAGDSSDLSATPEDRDLMGSADACMVRVGLIMGPPSMGLSQFLVSAQEDQTFNDFEFTVNGVDYVGLSAAFNQGDFDICTLPSNIGPILYNNDELKNEYKVISINNLGVLYVLTTDPSISSMDDLAGRTVYSYGEGGTPEYTIEALLNKQGVADNFTLEFKSSPFEALNLLQEEPNCVAILPQPFVSLSKIMVDTLYVPISLTDEWNKAFSDTGSQAVTTTTIVNKVFLEEHEQAVIEYLHMAGSSVAWTLENMETAAALQEELGTFLNDEVALDAMPQISMVNLTGTTMRTALSGFLDELYAANPDSIGGAIPDDGFYYLPPMGYLDDEVAQAGLKEATGGTGSTSTDITDNTDNTDTADTDGSSDSPASSSKD